MSHYIYGVFIIKAMLLGDLFIHFLLVNYLVRGESYYLSGKVEKAPQILIIGAVFHYIAFYGFNFLDNQGLSSAFMYSAYVLLMAYVIYIGILLLSKKEFKFSAAFFIQGIGSLALLAYVQLFA